MPDERWNELFAALRSNRDRAILATAVSNGVRALELLRTRGATPSWNAPQTKPRAPGTRLIRAG
ncbi:hypothetical protein [Streptomyces sp. NBC_01481]|uniref:hypothetical protein n=1 Tax=Streptomyces sp. NBC_01481 TaxID=2975869 RepID=UPI00224E8EB6|nr:hypothetical protein [Streptomyces sp. NBC_01481]MCX4586226.1 hypothetical protein [Streptomyces sp. NBC_01481]